MVAAVCQGVQTVIIVVQMEIASEHLLKMTALVMLIRENQAAKPTTEGTVVIAFLYPH
jgi:hypothetical protein